MHISKAKLSFIRRIVRNRLARQRRACPYCGESSNLELIGRKKVLLDVIRCKNCLLIFRWPMDTTIDNYAYYQDEYRAGLTTDLPTEHQLESMARESFRGSPLDLSQKIQILKALRPSGVVLDYGCSWGYGVYQLLAHGYRALGFEISKPRATLGREKLGVEILDEPRDLYGLPEKSFDIVFTNHALEHIPAVGEVFNLFARLLSEDGLVFCILPNFTGKLARSGMFWNWIGEAHPIAPTWDLFERNLPKHGFRRVVCGSGPFDDKLAELILKGAWDQLDSEGDELLVVAWR